jgi:hypothetical protein
MARRRRVSKTEAARVNALIRERTELADHTVFEPGTVLDIQEHYPTWGAFLAAAQEPCAPQWQGDCASRSGRASFTGTENFQEAVDLCLQGWPAGREKMDHALAIARPERQTQYHRAHDVAGAYPDIMRAIGGDPACMITPKRSEIAAHPVVRVTLDCSNSGIISAEAITNWGAALLSIVDAMETKGYSVEVNLMLVAKADDGREQYTCTVPFKVAGEALDIDRAAFALAHPSLLRRFIFALIERHGNLYSNFQTGYGSPRRCLPPDYDDASVYVHSALNDYLNVEHARAAMAKVFDKFMGES